MSPPILFHHVELLRWISEIGDSTIKVYAKIGILLHSLINVYENVMVGILGDIFLN